MKKAAIKKIYTPIIVVCAFFILAGILRINELSMYTDGVRYLIWANSLSQFEGFVDTTVPIPDPYVPNAPGYSVLLTPIQFVFPYSVIAGKIFTILCGAIALFLLYRWLTLYFSPTTSLWGVAFLGVNSLFFFLSSEVMSEAPFLALSFLIFYYLEKFDKNKLKQNEYIILVFLIGTIGLIREIGYAYIAAAIIYLLKQKRSKEAVVFFLAWGIGFSAWYIRNLISAPDISTVDTADKGQTMFSNFATSPDSSIFYEFLQRILINGWAYFKQIGMLVVHSAPTSLLLSSNYITEVVGKFFGVLGIPLSLLVMLIVVPGIITDFKKKKLAYFRLAALLVMIAILLVYPENSFRFLVTLLPFFIFYGIIGVMWIYKRSKENEILRKTAFVVAIGILLLNVNSLFEAIYTNQSYVNNQETFYSELDSTQKHLRYFSHPYNKKGKWLQENNIPEDALIATPVKDIALFIGKRKALEMNMIVPSSFVDRLLRDHGADYILTRKEWDDFDTYQFALEESNHFRFEHVHQISNLTLYRIVPILKSQSLVTRPLRIDTLSAKSSVLTGRRYLQQGQVNRSIPFFLKAQAQAPREPEPVTQLIIGFSLLLDSINAVTQTQNLFLFPRSTVYSYLAQAHLNLMLNLNSSLKTKDNIRATKIQFDCARSYWDLGYYKIARNLMQSIVAVDSNYYSAVLWSVYYNHELGEYEKAKRYLQRLRKIDSRDPLYLHWVKLFELYDMIKRTGNSKKRAEHHLEMAKIYFKLELLEETLDALERSLAENPRSIESLELMTKVYEKKNAQLAIRKVLKKIISTDPNNKFAQEKAALHSFEL